MVKARLRFRYVRWIILFIVLGFITGTGYLIYKSADPYFLEMTYYQHRTDKVSDNVRIVHLTDLHNKEFGKDNATLLERVVSLKPDLIVITGDMITMEIHNYEVAVSLCEKLIDIAPTFYSYGNHEYGEIIYAEGNHLISDLKSTGITLLNCESTTIDIKGNEIKIGGMCTDQAGFYAEDIQRFLNDFIDPDAFTLLLTHYPNIFEDLMKPFPVDIAFTGHAHGGQVRLPIIGGVFAPDQGIFPKWTEGFLMIDSSMVVINRGLGNIYPIPRINNSAEIVVMDINWY